MPKMKTRSAAAKRARITPTGKVMTRHARQRHLLVNKPPRRKRRLSRPGQLTGADAKTIKTQLPRH
jgi:large subunit ribosomal protein L35